MFERIRAWFGASNGGPTATASDGDAVAALVAEKAEALVPASERPFDLMDERWFVDIDEEELVEGSWDHFQAAMQVALAREGADYDATVVDTDTGWLVRPQGRDYWFVEQGDQLLPPSHHSCVRYARLVNGYLRTAGSSKRLFYVNGWNDLCGVLLTPEVRQVLEGTPWDKEVWDGDDGLPVEAPVPEDDGG